MAPSVEVPEVAQPYDEAADAQAEIEAAVAAGDAALDRLGPGTVSSRTCTCHFTLCVTSALAFFRRVCLLAYEHIPGGTDHGGRSRCDGPGRLQTTEGRGK